ncbi:hypothetical protein OKW43_004898 [Paraburkholderia sp. WC7.3g]|uniref:Uncharacterized protein n=1 Tax=Paraburkholderia podalyriae TaxID=1938811 RepID=A0ABR7PJE8_9BURK|nr:hypothetical protein [Paraburkholderia podalyriae]
MSEVAAAAQEERLSSARKAILCRRKTIWSTQQIERLAREGAWHRTGRFLYSRKLTGEVDERNRRCWRNMENAGLGVSRSKIQMTCWIPTQESSPFCNLKMLGVDEQRRKNPCNEAD